MAKNLTWCLMRNVLRNNNYTVIRYIPQKTITRYEHAVKGYVPVVDDSHSNIDYHEVKTYSQYLDENQRGFDSCVKTLVNLLDVTKDNAIKVAVQWKVLSYLSKSTIIKNHDLLRRSGVFKSTLRQYMFVLADSPDSIKSKIKILKKIGIEPNYALPLFQLSALQLAGLVKLTAEDRVGLPDFPNRIEYLASKFQVDTRMICSVLCRHPALLTHPIERIVAMTDLFLVEFKVKPEHLLSDLNVYTNSYDNVKERLLRAQRAGIEPLKPWVVRCEISIIEKAERKKENWERLCPSSTLEEHMSKILKCDIQYTKALLERAPFIRGLCIVKLTDLLEYLVSVGYTVHDIYRSPTILHCVKKTIKDKFDSWIATGLPPPYIGVLCASKKIFKQSMEKKLEVDPPDPTNL